MNKKPSTFIINKYLVYMWSIPWQNDTCGLFSIANQFYTQMYQFVVDTTTTLWRINTRDIGNLKLFICTVNSVTPSFPT